MTDPSDSFPVPGDLFQGRYKVERVIGAGGFSRVYLATQTDLGRKVALKIMRPVAKVEGDVASSTASVAALADRFLQEARVVANLRGPYTVTVHDHGRTDDGHLFMVLEYVDGVALSTMIKEIGALDASRVKKILRQTLESLQEAHAHGLLHRDIKPANIMVYEHLGKPDNVKVLDFGIAKVVGPQIDTEDHEDLTQSGSLLGTPRYMSPEQLRGQELTGATDIYSLGLVAYEMLMGKKAIETHSSVMIIGAQLDPRPFAVPNQPHIPPRLRMIINRMLSKELKNRYATVDEVLADLEQVDTGMFGAIPTPPRDRLFTPIGEMPDISDSLEMIQVEEVEGFDLSDEPANDNDDRNRKLLIATALASVVLLLVITVAVLTSGPKPDEQQAEGEPQTTQATEAESTVAAVVPAEAKEPAEDEVPEKIKEKDDKPEITEVVVSTIPAAAQIYINDVNRGLSPITISTADMKFPAKIRAVASGGGERLTVVDAAVPHVEIDLSMVVKAEQPKQPTISKRPTHRPKKPTKPDKKPDPKPDEKPDDNKFTLPALDY